MLRNVFQRKGGGVVLFKFQDDIILNKGVR